MNNTKLILASGSPRRIELFQRLGLSFSYCVADIDETPLTDEAPVDYVLRLAERKAVTVGLEAETGEVIVAADTIVVDGETLLGKPVSPAEAEIMLKSLRGRTHHVNTAMAVFRKDDGLLATDYCISSVPMRQYSDGEIISYIQSGDPMDKAGAYAIQNNDFHPVVGFGDCYACVVGLPMCHMANLLASVNVNIDMRIPELCEQQFNYQCKIFDRLTHAVQIVQVD